MAETEQIILPRAEFIDDIESYLKGKDLNKALDDLGATRQKYKMLEQQLLQKKAQLMSKLPEIQKALDIVNTFIAKQGEELILDYELGESIYAKTKVSNVKHVNLWLGADVMVEYTLEEAKTLLTQNLGNCKTNLKTVDSDLDAIRENIATFDVSISRIWNYGVEQRRQGKETGLIKG